MKVKDQSEKAGLKQNSETEDHGIWSITSCQIDEDTMETVTDLIFFTPRSLRTGTASMK